jgi:hypothetical protein
MKKKHPREVYDAWIIENADYFTVVAFLGRGKYERHEVATLKEAKRMAKGLQAKTKRRYLIYAVKGTADAVVAED